MSKRFKLFDTTEGAIELEGMEFHAFHGCLEQERREGNTFIVDFYAETDLSEAAESDDLKDTVDYGKVYDIVAREMAIPSNLLEHVASRILKAVEDEFDGFTYTRVRVSKKNPPVNGTCAWSRVTVASGQRLLDRI